jgi:hypothetical protein
MSSPTWSVNLTNDAYSLQINESHSSACAMAMVECKTYTGDIGSEITISINGTQKFIGYVKEIHRNVPDTTYTLVSYDRMVRASDFMLVASDPDVPFTRSNILAEDLVRDLMAQAGLTSYASDVTYFTCAPHNPVDIDVVGVYDYCKQIADLLTYAIWCDSSGTVQFRNRKPYTMVGSEPQPGWVNDTPTGYEVNVNNCTRFTRTVSEKNLRNRIVVRGSDVTGEASASSPYLPIGFYKTSVLGAPQLLETQEMVDDSADYNLYLFNCLTDTIDCTVIGDEDLSARQVIAVNIFGITGNYYVFSNNITLNKSGFVNNLNLRKRV